MDSAFSSDPLRAVKCSLYDADRALAIKQQGSDVTIKQTLEDLHRYIRPPGHPNDLDVPGHPYDLYTPQWREIVAVIDGDPNLTLYHESAAGIPAILESTDGFLYKITSHNSLFRLGTRGQRSSPGNWDPEADAFEGNGLDRDPSAMFTHLYKRSKASPIRWLALSEFATGAVATPRNHSFWSDYEHPEGVESFQTNLTHLVQFAYRVGLPANFLGPQMYVLRCKKADAHLLMHIPTAIDAFDFAVFYPMQLSQNPRAGKAINLSELRHYFTADDSDRAHHLQEAITTRRTETLLANEYTLRPIPVENIEILPVSFNLPTDQDLQQDNLYRHLTALYQAL